MRGLRCSGWTWYRWAWIAAAICGVLFQVAGQAAAQGSSSSKAASIATPGVFDATELREPASPGPVWLVHAGDDPAYSQADVDDKTWTPFALDHSLKTLFPGEKPQVVWYRLHVKVRPDQTELALMSRGISAAFELYVNGALLLKNGEVSPFKASSASARTLVRIPEEQMRTGSLTIALRVYISRTGWSSPNPGLELNELTIGQQHQLWEHLWIRVIGVNALYWLNSLLVCGLGLVALALFSAQRGQREYLWIFLQAVAQVAALPWTLITLFHDLPAQWGFAQLLFNVLNFIFQALMYFAFLRLPISRWLKIYFGITGFVVVASVASVSVGALPTYVLGICLLPFSLLLNAVIPILLLIHLRRGNREAGILLIPALLNGFAYYAGLVLFFLALVPSFAKGVDRFEQALFGYEAGPFSLSLEDIGYLLFNLSLLLILVLRSNRMSRQQAVFEGELEAASEVQAVLLPERADSVPHFLVDSVYQPAQKVGGDFFQVLPVADGGLLLVFGDVAGKGLPAAMLVSMLVGSIRTAAEESFAPAVLLAKLNERLIGRSRGGFTTALAAHFRLDGTVALANAGHLSPYLDGTEVTLPGSLPLGVESGASYEVVETFLVMGARLTFYSDGVVEAMKANGELLGFDRAAEISTQPAASIVRVAQSYGQNDDITVVSITRTEAGAAA